MGKKIWGRKRHVLVDTQGNLMELKVTAASDSDLAGAKKLLEPLKNLFPRLSLLWDDGHYRGSLVEWVKEHLGWDIHVVQRLLTASDGQIGPRVAQRDGLSRELALSLTLTRGHLIGLQPRPRSCKQPDEA